MKRCVAILLIVLYFSLPLFSYITQISSSIHNDSFTMGIAENYDDLRSYGFNFSIETSSHLNANIALSGITLRNNQHPTMGSRVDEIYVSVDKRFPFFYSQNYTNILSLFTLQGGLFLVGNLGFEGIQNRWHDMIGVAEVHLPYCMGGSVSLYPQIGLNYLFSIFEKVPFFSFTQIFAEIEGNLTYAPEYKSSMAVGLNIGQISSLESSLQLGVGFIATESLQSFPLLQKTANSEEGLYIDVIGRMGVLRMKYRTYPHLRRSFGGIGITLYSDEKHKDSYYLGNDLILSFGGQVFKNFKTTMIARYSITPSFGIYLSNSFGSRALEYVEYTRQNSSKWHLGVDYQFTTLANDLLLPFVSIGGGFRRIILSKDTGIENSRELLLDNSSFLFNTEVGMRLFHDGRFKIGSIAYGLEVSGGVSITSNEDIKEEIVFYHMVAMDDIQPYVRLAIFSAGSL